VNGSSRRRLTRALEGLDARARALLSLSRLEGLEVSEIASLFAATPERVAREMTAAERSLRQAARHTERRRA
jgi:RNA polymerase sigma factor (sigma-70 family)